MEVLGLYLLKSVCCITLFFGVYWCFLKNETFFRFNRYFLISGLICSILLPFYTYTYELRLNLPISNAANELSAGIDSSLIKENLLSSYVGIAYAVIVLFLLARHIFGLLKIKKVISKSGYRSIKNCRLVSTPEFKSSFSVFNYIFFDSSEELSDTEKKMILRHELAHVKQAHWADLVLAQLFCSLQWFNPLAWIYLKAIRQNHEFLADEHVLKQGSSVAGYRAVLLNHFVGTRVFSISSAFYHYPQQRIKMLARPASVWIKKTAVLSILPALAFFLWAFSEPEIILQEPAATQQRPALEKSAIEKPAARNEVMEATAMINNPIKKVAVGKNKRTSLKISARPEIKLENQPVTPQENQLLTERNHTIDVKVNGKENSVISPKPLFFLDGVEMITDINSINPNHIEAINIIKGAQAIEMYGDRAKDGVIQITTKNKTTANLKSDLKLDKQ
ncbi:M56 family metallopeptidase [Pedobacter gandavensis]|uniref:M56 family metallopeptidase n=1 Tax=Pedobacter gandavensis TaxID=2679963 RepID=UPI00293108FB|nr:M56 family metallopeptidase [Pedobacter gandavensis]